MSKQTSRRRSHARRVSPRFFVILFLLLVTIVLGVLVLRRVLDLPGKPAQEAVLEPEKQEEKDGFLSGLFSRKTPEPTAEPAPTPEPTPTPVPAFAPAATERTQPAVMGMETAIEENGMVVTQYRATEPVDFRPGDEYTALEGVITFRGNNFRDSASYGTVTLSEKTIEETPWTFEVGSLRKVYNSGAGGGSWTGCGWTGQPLIVKWPEETKRIMNMYDAAKADPALVEVIYATMDGNIYFLNLDTGAKTRDPIHIGYPFKGAGALDPRGYPLMYVGSGDDSPNEGQGSSRAFIISLIDGKVLHTFGNGDGFALRDLSYFDSSALVDAASDTLIYPGESGVLYRIKLNTQYDPNAGSISVAPQTTKWRYKGTRTNTSGVNGEKAWWLGVEDSAILWRGHAIFTDNGGHMMCLDLNTLELVWVQDTLDDTNCTPVLALEGADKHPYVYTSTSFHAGWRVKETGRAKIPIWKIDAVTGEIVWTNENYACETISGVSGGVQGTMVMGKNKLSDWVFVPVAMTEGSKGKLVALSKADGREVWACDFAGYPWSSPVAVYDAAGNGYLIQCNKSGYIHLIDGMTGAILYEKDLGSNIEASPAIYGNTVVVGTRGGLIYGIKLK